MYTTFSNTFATKAEGPKKFFFTVNKPAAGGATIYEAKINDDKQVKKFKMKQEAGQWKIQGEDLPTWVLDMESEFGARIEASDTGKK